MLADKVHAFNPNYADTRFVKNLSRRQQIELELHIPSRGGKKGANNPALNFFVDTYSDE